MQYRIPQDRGGLNAYPDQRFAQQTSARLEVQQVYHSAVNSRPAMEAPVEHTRGGEHPTFSQVEPFLYEVADWMAFNRKEVTGNDRIS